MTDTKTTHFGRAAEYFAMSELLLRGWNVAVPVVDVGDDVFIIDDRDKTTWRVQVKASRGAREGDGDRLSASFSGLSRVQLRKPEGIELFYMLVVRAPTAWRFLVIPRAALLAVRLAFVEAGRTRPGRGRRPLSDGDAKGDDLTLHVAVAGDTASAWNQDVSRYLDRWPGEIGIVEGGPGTVSAGTTEQATAAMDAALDPPRDRKT